MYLGIDLGTSALKLCLCDVNQTIIAQTSVPLEISRPQIVKSIKPNADLKNAYNDKYKSYLKLYPAIKSL